MQRPVPISNQRQFSVKTQEEGRLCCQKKREKSKRNGLWKKDETAFRISASLGIERKWFLPRKLWMKIIFDEDHCFIKETAKVAWFFQANSAPPRSSRFDWKLALEVAWFLLCNERSNLLRAKRKLLIGMCMHISHFLLESWVACVCTWFQYWSDKWRSFNILHRLVWPLWNDDKSLLCRKKVLSCLVRIQDDEVISWP